MILKEVCELIVDCEHKTANIQSEGCPSIRTPNIGPGYLILEGVNRVSDETYRKWTARAIPQYGDLIMAREAPVGNVAMIPRGLQVCLGQRTLLIRPIRDKVDPRFLVYLLLGEEVQGVIHGMTNGATVPHLNMKDVRALPLPILPELLTQQKIAAILSAYDDLIENNLRRIKILEEMAQSLYREWFVKFRFPGHEQARFVDSLLGRVPEGWEVRKITELLKKVKRGLKIQKKDYAEKGFIPIVDQGREFLGGYTEDIESLNSGELPLIIFGDHTRILKFIDFPFACGADGTQLLKSNNERMPMALFYYTLLSIDLSDFAYARHFKFLKEKPIILPSLEISMSFEDFVLPLREQIRSLMQRNANLRRTREMLLPKLISGEVDVSELDIAIPEEAAA